jgi:hypothetical protein
MARSRPAPAPAGFWRRNGLSIVLLALMLGSLTGQVVAGQAVLNEERAQHHRPPLVLVDYLRSGQFVSATFENWESEFLQMGMYVLLTVWLRQAGSAESRPVDPAKEHENIEPGPKPWPLRRGGIWRRLYANSLSLALFALFALSWGLHVCGSWRQAVDQRLLDGQPPITLVAYLGDAQLWFESLQNWQSEFLAVLAIVVLSIFLRQDKSPESKPLEAPNSQTGS